jgi:protein XagA
MRSFYSVLIAALFFATPHAALAGAWTMNQGGLYTKLSYNRYVTDSIFGKGGGRDSLPNKGKFYDNNVTFYGEYGLTDRITLSASLPYKSLRSSYWRNYEENDQDKREYVVKRYHGGGDVEVGLKYGLLQTPFVGAVQFLYKNAGLYTSRETVMPGNNQSDYELRLLAGKSLWPFPGYCGAEAGYRFRTKAPSDEFKYLLEFGIDLTQKLSLRLKLDGTKSMHNARKISTPQPQRSAYVEEETGQVIVSQNASVTSAASTNPSLGLEYDLGKFETALNYKFTERWSGEVSYTAYPYGKNISPGRMYSIGIVYYFENKKK